MARMHGRKKGKSSSAKPQRTVYPKWQMYDSEELAELIVEIYKNGNPPSKIGLILRDQYGIPSTKVAVDKKVTTILKEKGIELELPEDLYNLVNKAVKLRKHLDQHSHDKHNKRGLQLIESKIFRLTKYYKGAGVIPSGWFYDPEKIKLLV
ncbi:MAG: 30S ribosomal protein S15 [Candidatus Altiarchaeota archaeon]